MGIDFDTVRRLGLALPGVEASTSYGAPSLKLHGQLFVCPAINKSAEPGSLMVRVDLDRRAELLEGDPATYYVTNHYVNYPCVLVRMSRINVDVLRDLLLMSWKFVSAMKRPRKRALRRTRS